MRKRLDWAKIPPGTHHIKLPEGYAVLKDVGRSKPHHVVASVLSAQMHPPGRELSSLLKQGAVSGLNKASMASFVSELAKIVRSRNGL